MKWIARPYQKIMVSYILDHPRCSLMVFMGAGKTVSTLTAIAGLLMAGSVNRVLVVAPLRVARSVWGPEAAQWDHLNHLKVSLILGSEKQRSAAIAVDADIYCVNYENLEWLAAKVGDAWPWDTVVCDESSKLKGFRSRQGTRRAKALAAVAHTKVRRFISSTGTPASNGIKDLWGQLWFTDQGHRLGRTYSAFMARWFRPRPGGDARYPVMEAMPHAQEEIQSVLKDICLTLKAEDWFDLEEPVVNTIYVDLPPEVRKRYKEMEATMFTVLDGIEIEAFGAAAKTMACLQLANGAKYVNGSNEEWVEVHDEKIEALRSVIEETAGAPLLVVFNFRSDLARLRRHFPDGRGLDSDPRTIDAWNRGEIPLLFLHPASAGHGLSLQHGGNTVVFFGLNWNLEEHMQVIERIGPVRQKQSGYNRAVFVHYIVARKTVDETVLERLKSKRSVQEILLDAMNEYKAGAPVKDESRLAEALHLMFDQEEGNEE